MIVRKLRLQRGWSQEQLAQLSGLSTRTVQRIERGQSAGLESMKSLAAVFEIELTQLQQEKPMDSQTQASTEVSTQEQAAIEYVRGIKDFYTHLSTYVLVVSALFVFNYWTNPSYIWAWWTALGWGIGIISHALAVFEVFNLFGADWEKKQIEKRLGRKL
ncbi:2TM domain-containing protein [Thalassomonas actiniarum]|uniref:2TM domain-containing protein n=1 Tax=Thalassomonas actiniarum TaxID=485447 RepID=A0AAE9YUN7_9GAMM|nr:2TM domain-containing protein [Thalassomonas actiniarum]WDD99971.1 2TM domain-containing protein [Thalassomonas actiniarum]